MLEHVVVCVLHLCTNHSQSQAYDGCWISFFVSFIDSHQFSYHNHLIKPLETILKNWFFLWLDLQSSHFLHQEGLPIIDCSTEIPCEREFRPLPYNFLVKIFFFEFLLWPHIYKQDYKWHQKNICVIQLPSSCGILSWFWDSLHWYHRAVTYY